MALVAKKGVDDGEGAKTHKVPKSTQCTDVALFADALCGESDARDLCDSLDSAEDYGSCTCGDVPDCRRLPCGASITCSEVGRCGLCIVHQMHSGRVCDVPIFGSIDPTASSLHADLTAKFADCPSTSTRYVDVCAGVSVMDDAAMESDVAPGPIAAIESGSHSAGIEVKTNYFFSDNRILNNYYGNSHEGTESINSDGGSFVMVSLQIFLAIVLFVVPVGVAILEVKDRASRQFWYPAPVNWRSICAAGLAAFIAGYVLGLKVGFACKFGMPMFCPLEIVPWKIFILMLDACAAGYALYTRSGNACLFLLISLVIFVSFF